MATGLRLTALLALGLLVASGSAQTCITNTTSCNNFLNFNTGASVFLAANVTEASVAAAIATLLDPAVLLNGNTQFPDCYSAVVFLICSSAYPRCNADQTAGMYPCKSACQHVLDSCDGGNLLPQDHVPHCDQPIASNGASPGLSPTQYFEESNCVSYGGVIAVPPTQPSSCSAPLVLDPHFGDNTTAPNPFCSGGCCVPCPPVNYLFTSGLVDAIETLLCVLSLISFFAALFVVFGYSVQAKKRQYPSVIILYLAIAVCIFFLPAWYNVLDDGYAMRCNDEVTIASPGTWNSYTISNAFITVYGIMCAAFWYGFLVFNIWMSVIFMYQNLDLYPWIWQPLCWLGPLAFPIAALAGNSMGYEFGSRALPSRGTWLNGTMLIPLACIIWPSTVLNFHVLFKIFLVGRRRNAQFRTILRLQIRPLLFCLTCLSIFMFFWLHDQAVFSHNANIEPNAPWVPAWFNCTYHGGGQDFCAENYSMPYLFSAGLYTVSEGLVAIIGIIIFLFFGLKKDLLYGVLNVFRADPLTMPSSYHSGDSGSGNGSSGGSSNDLNNRGKKGGAQSEEMMSVSTA